MQARRYCYWNLIFFPRLGRHIGDAFDATNERQPTYFVLCHSRLVTEPFYWRHRHASKAAYSTETLVPDPVQNLPEESEIAPEQSQATL